MPTPKQVAAAALAKCAAYDPWFPKPDRAMVEAWAELIERHDISMDQAMAGVTKMYDDNGSGFKPLPRDLIRACRETRLAIPETDEERDARNLANDVRLGLDTSWYKTAEQLAAITDVEGRRRAIEQFAKGYGGTARGAGDNMGVMTSASGRNYAAVGVSLRKHPEVSEDEAQPQDGTSVVPFGGDNLPDFDGDDCPHCHFPNGCLVDHACLGMDYRHK